jgi:hypothetical protein
MSERSMAGPGHTERHTMKESGRTIRVHCLCRLGQDHRYRDGSERPAASAPLGGADRSEQR